MKENKVKWINRALMLYAVFSRHLKKNKPLTPKMEFQRIAIYSTTALGDLMFNTPAIHALKQRYPQASFVLVTSEKNRPLVVGSSWFDDVFTWDNKIRDAYPLIRKLRNFKPQLTVILHSYMPYDILCAVLSHSEYIIRDNYRVDSPLINHWLNAYSSATGQHLIQRKLDLLSVLGVNNNDTRMRIPVDWTPASKVEGKIRIGFQLGASEASRCWPVARFAELAVQLSKDDTYQVVLTGGAKDRNLVAQFEKMVGDVQFSRIENWVGKTSLKELLTLIDGLDVLVTGDTGPLHLAVALQTATVSLYADAEPKHTGPYQDLARHCILKMEGGMSASIQPLECFSAQEIQQKIVQLMAD